MTVVVIFVSRLATVLIGDQHHEISQQIRQGVHAIGDQAL
jgi:hypothetical protein